MKKNIILLACFTALIISGCRKIEMDGDGDDNPNPNPGGGGETITLKGRINTDMTLTKNNNYILSDKVYIVDNKTLTIEAGTVIKGAYSGSEVAVLVITRGAKIVANGTASEPIVFTSSSPSPRSGDWGGIVICGKASINTTSTEGGQGTLVVEGGINNANNDALAGGGTSPDDNDSSGVLKYVRIEYAGYAFQPDKEVNSLTMAAVGRKTLIDNVQVSYAKDDGFEWFGGTVNCKHLISYKTQDDDFDTDNGFSGSVQYGLIVRDSLIADVSKSESFESDNNSTGQAVLPQTRAVFSNISSFGPVATPNNNGSSNYLGSAVQIRRNSSISIFNSAFVGWKSGIEISNKDGEPTSANITDKGTLQLSAIYLAGVAKPIVFVAKSGQPSQETELTTWFLSNPKNKIEASADAAKYTRPFDYANPDFLPFANNSPLLGVDKVDFDHQIIKDRAPFIEKVDFIGAIGPSGAASNWHKGWTRIGNE